MVAIRYFEVEYLPGTPFFRCEAHRTTLSVGSCAAQYHRHKDGCSACTGCAIGAEHAGEKVERAISGRLCLRCGATDKRLIHGHMCVSCYNRQREVLCGRNGKGQRPVRARPVFDLDVAVVGGTVQHVSLVASSAEAVLSILRRRPDALVATALAPPIPAIRGMSMSMFGWLPSRSRYRRARRAILSAIGVPAMTLPMFGEAA